MDQSHLRLPPLLNPRHCLKKLQGDCFRGMVAFEYDNWLCLCLVLKSLTIEREGWDAPAFVSVTLAYVAGSLAAVREPTILRAARYSGAQ